MSNKKEFQKAPKKSRRLVDNTTKDKRTVWITTSGTKASSGLTLKATRSNLVFVSDAYERFLTGSVLGIGSYGIVKASLDAVSLKRMAVKLFIHGRINRIPGGHESVLSELKITKSLKHENIQPVYHVIKKQKDWMMMMEMCKCNVEELMEMTTEKRLSNILTHYFFVQLVEGLAYIQSMGVAHLDIKPDNLLLSHDNTLKISDFGVAQKLDMFKEGDICTIYRGSPVIQSPEIARGDDTFHGFKVDIWSSGVTLFKMLTGDWPFEAMNAYMLAERIINDSYTIPPFVNPTAAHFINQLLTYEASNRPDVMTVKKHEWLLHDHPTAQVAKELELLDRVEEKTSVRKTLQHFKRDVVEVEAVPSENLLEVYNF